MHLLLLLLLPQPHSSACTSSLSYSSEGMAGAPVCKHPQELFLTLMLLKETLHPITSLQISKGSNRQLQKALSDCRKGSHPLLTTPGSATKCHQVLSVSPRPRTSTRVGRRSQHGLKFRFELCRQRIA